jgi:nucleotide-binding universal stress UspA family protein
MPSNEKPRYPAAILCPTDLGPYARHAIAYAAALARPARASITLMYVSPLPLPAVADELPEWMPAEGLSPGTRLADELQQLAAPLRASGVATDLHFREGTAGEEIVRAASDLGADLIAMGTHGRRGMQRVLGSHAQHVLRFARCPVLTVSRPLAVGEEGPVSIRRILCAASGAEQSAATIAYAARLAAGAGTQLSLVQVREPGVRAPRLPVPAEGIPVDVEQHVVSGDPYEEIVKAARRDGADLIVVGRHDRAPGILGFFGSTCGRLMQAAPCAVLAVPARPALPVTKARLSA